MASALDTALFRKFMPLNSLNARSQRNLVRKCSLESAAAGSYLFKSGDVIENAVFLLDGVVQLEDAAARPVGIVRSGEAASFEWLAHQSPRRLAARCIGDVHYLSVDAGLLEVLLGSASSTDFEVAELIPGGNEPGSDWMTRLLRMRVFQLVPPTNLQAMFMRMTEVFAEPGEVIVRQGEVGDYFYVIIEGRCVVIRESPGMPPVRLAELDAGCCFGEEALIAGDRRNATVTMLGNGRLKRLSAQDFRALLKEPLSRGLDYAEASRRVAAGAARWLDVRLPTEFDSGHLPASINLPLHLLRTKLVQLDPAMSWIAVCDNGQHSTVAAFILGEKGYDAWLLGGGLSRWPL
jgi:CRP-like cAMP-binding protein